MLREGSVENRKEAVATFLTGAGSKGDSTAALEATRNWTVLHDCREELVEEVHPAHPLKLKAIAEAKIKTDKIDARVLAHLLEDRPLTEGLGTRSARAGSTERLRQRGR